jgi:hypothetical protein
MQASKADWTNRAMGPALLVLLLALLSPGLCKQSSPFPQDLIIQQKLRKALIALPVCLGLLSASPSVHARSSLETASVKFHAFDLRGPSKRWEMARQKRTAAIKELQAQGVLRVDTDDAGNQYLRLPWLPDQRVPYKTLSTQQRLATEVFAGAFGEIAKDSLLHWVDTLKTRRQAAKKSSSSTNHGVTNSTVVSELPMNASDTNILQRIRGLYAGFPVVALASVPQGGVFFLVKKGLLEAQATYFPHVPELFALPLSICMGVAAYWIFRTPAEVLKTQVQTGQQPDVLTAFRSTREQDSEGVKALWRYYPVVLWLDIPFQIVNFLLYGAVSDALVHAGIPMNILSRLVCGISCGMLAAGLTCPLDVCKTRIISRDKELRTMQGTSTTGKRSLPEEFLSILKNEGVAILFLGLRQRLLYTGLANGIRLAAYGSLRMDLMMRSLDNL